MEEMSNLYIFSNGQAIACRGSIKSPGIVEVRSSIPEPMDGFELVITTAPKVLLIMHVRFWHTVSDFYYNIRSSMLSNKFSIQMS